ncbi:MULTISPECIES: type II 3-dehydroquinate dehydratase [Actinoplanes]|uniref:3-dehydroquinate dehydratase n=2 Tax=Actinoplanes TaxID=1865 RepID=A0A101JDA3_9ACTN|nr:MULTISPECIES: type II 3-dehydroquinate dehydratase [Actinoplanes]KUL24723.1 3-dehydroquinate dehydratase [Actinoplanes awajinensis subsp. mycoplanecinus]GIE67969.1 3-dehydroquinate dehydratase [Actinoplanes palleronii]
MIYVLNGPNLNRLGTREPDIYGKTTYQDLVDMCLSVAEDLGVTVQVEQTNAEHQMIEWLHRAVDEGADVVLNPAAWTHYNIAIRDACALLRGKLVEVHISNIHQREEWRHHSVISAVATGVIAGLGIDGYRLALEHICR